MGDNYSGFLDYRHHSLFPLGGTGCTNPCGNPAFSGDRHASISCFQTDHNVDDENFESSDSAMRLTPIFLRPFFWLSGIFFIAAEVPGWALDWLWFNPLMHSIELLRSGFFVDFNSTFAQSNVPIIAIVVFYFSSRLIEAHIDLQPGRGVFSP